MEESNLKDFLQEISRLKIDIVENEPLSRHTFYNTGGKCKAMIYPTSVDNLKQCLSILKGQKLFILGNGSNVLVSDKGFNGFVINTKKVNKITIKGDLIVADAGANLVDVVNLSCDNCLSGLEFAIGIPASVGGAVCMNSGCFGKTIGEYVVYVKGENGIYNNKNCNFDYRTSRFSQEGILQVCFKLKPWDNETIQGKLEHYKKIRFNKAPKGKSCGSVFKNEEYFAGKLIDEAGLKGFSIGGAKISEKHANYVINYNNATSQDIYSLIKHVKKRVYSLFEIDLKEELKYVGDFDD